MYRMVFIKVLCRLTLMGLLFAVISCSSYRTLSVEVMQPAKVKLDQGTSIALLDRNVRVDDDINRMLIRYDDISRENLFIEFMEGMRYVLDGSSLVDTLLPLAVGEVTVTEDDFFPAPISSDTVKYLCRRFGLDYLATVELQYYKPVQQQLHNNWLLRLYRADSGCSMDSCVLCAQVDQSSVATEDFAGGILAGAWEKGSEYGRHIVPWWEPTERRIYNGGKVLRLGDYYLREGNTGKALEVWTAALGMSPKIALRAAIDLAWIYENAGDFSQAAALLERAEELAENQNLENAEVDYLRKYARVIRQRIEKSRVLDQQMVPE